MVRPCQNFYGKILKWNDPAIIALNPERRLPDLKISVIYREDKSGTTFNFTNYLSKNSDDWKNNIGEGLLVKWPVVRLPKAMQGWQ